MEGNVKQLYFEFPAASREAVLAPYGNNSTLSPYTIIVIASSAIPVGNGYYYLFSGKIWLVLSLPYRPIFAHRVHDFVRL